LIIAYDLNFDINLEYLIIIKAQLAA
jgi:hypothetical protein